MAQPQTGPWMKDYRNPQGQVVYWEDILGNVGLTSIQFPDGTVQSTANAGIQANSIVGPISQFNPAADGVTDDSAKFTTAQGTYNEIWLTPNKQYFIGTNLSLSASLRFPAGSQLVIGTGVTLTLTGTVQAPLNKIFVIQGTGKVVMGTRNSNYVVYPEWWGAVGDNTTDDTTALQAAINAVSGAGLGYMTTESSTPPTGVGTVVLGPKVYKISSALTIQSSCVGIRGQAMRCSIIMQTSATADIIDVVGTGTTSTTACSFVYLENFSVMRNVAPTGTPAGIKFTGAYVCFARSVESWDSVHGFELSGNVVHINLDHCYAQGGGQIGTNTGSCAGFYMSGSCNSSRLTSCIVTQNGVGFWFQGVADVFLDRCETNTSQQGFYVTGNSGDVIATSCVVEGGNGSIQVVNNNPTTGKVQFVNGYFHGVNTGNPAIWINNSSFVEVTGGDCTIPTNSSGLYFNAGSHDNRVAGVQFYINGGTNTANGAVCDGTSGTTRNIIANCNFYAPTGTHGHVAILLQNGAVHHNLVGNTIGGFWDTAGISLDATSNNNAVISNVVDPTNIATPINDLGTGNQKLNVTT